jgi:6-phosphofructokinase 1
VPISWISDSKNDVRPEIIDYMKPLIEGEINLSYRNGIPNYINLY